MHVAENEQTADFSCPQFIGQLEYSLSFMSLFLLVSSLESFVV